MTSPAFTLAGPVDLAGVGLHSGAPVRVRLLPGRRGIRFRRTDLPGSPEVPATLDAVRDTARGVTLGDPPVRTVEHLLSAAAGLGIWGLVVEVAGEELPALDGSARPLVEAMLAAGLADADLPSEPLRVREAVVVSRGEAVAAALPHDGFVATYAVTAPNAAVPGQVVTYRGEAYADAIAPARTWGRLDEAERLRAHGLARGASPDNTLVIGPEGFLTRPRLPDELARHKVLDLLGDLALLGRPVRAAIVAVGAGHALHVELARKIRDLGSATGDQE